MNRHRVAMALVAGVVLLATCAGCSHHQTVTAANASSQSPAAAGSPTASRTTTPLEGKWRASVSLAAAKTTLRAAGMGRLIPKVVTCSGCLPSPDFELRIAGDQWLLFNSGDVMDEGAITVNGDHVSIEASEVPGKAVLGFKVDGTTLHLSFVSQSRPKMAPGLTEEPIIRMLYTSVPWSRVS
jgi:hypothetical protein